MENPIHEARERAQLQEEAKRELYSRVFCGQSGPDEGQMVLTDILNELGFFDMHKETTVDLVRHNAALRILWNIGVWQPMNVWGITEAMCRLPHKDQGRK